MIQTQDIGEAKLSKHRQVWDDTNSLRQVSLKRQYTNVYFLGCIGNNIEVIV
jgi:hypothetical protein